MQDYGKELLAQLVHNIPNDNAACIIRNQFYISLGIFLN